MKRLFLFFIAVLAMAQTASHSVTITITDNNNPAGTGYNVYRAMGACVVPPSGSTAAPLLGPPIASDIGTKSYVDSPVAVGNSYCYAVTAVINGTESPQSNQVTVMATPFAPSITVVFK